ncbi:VOC family protein [candidate division KSB1 bacterium]|nr:VOC family protein [candidate division KSB1 bacterium]NIR70578.1 VOC family protein [candidate division KSB1 bacterium]NIS27714.1 VOC family protein [candidate division KSB1 bacterium]NIT74542.1 VOC family protein [candidate division KSB1 bacterium]NIU28367.1 VOC family protein [candidate division KSB1 bacterium]
MSQSEKPEVGTISWTDLTIENAEDVNVFYSKVVGWKSEPVDMGGYNDYNMNAPQSGKPMVGICHARGSNADLPPQWLVYITVEDVDESAKRCVELGGKVLVEPKGMAGYGRYCVIQDPAGAVAALYTPA